MLLLRRKLRDPVANLPVYTGCHRWNLYAARNIHRRQNAVSSCDTAVVVRRSARGGRSFRTVGGMAT